MLDDLDIEAPAKPKPRASASSKAAINYLIVSCATGISIIGDTDGIAISVGIKRDAVAIDWLRAEKARSVAALQEAAAQCRATLTPHDVVIARARRSRTTRRVHIIDARYGRARGIYKNLQRAALGCDGGRAQVHVL
jgi:hypothetical protein